jgi:hypothetical protein
MKRFPSLLLTLALAGLGGSALGQGAQADQIKRRAKELSNQNNVRQGVPPPSQPPASPAAKPATSPAPTAARPAAATPAATQQQSVARLTADFAAIKPGTAVSPEQKQQLLKNMALAVRGSTKPFLPTVTKFVNSLADALAEKSLGNAEQGRLAQNVEAVLNSERLPAAQFDAIIADVQAILQVSGAKRNLAVSAAHDLKAVGAEIRKAPAR